MNQNILYRLVLAKSLFQNAITSCDTEHDVYQFSQGIIGIHDALDNFAGALCSYLNISLNSRRSYLVNMVDEIENFEKQADPNFSLWSKNEIRQINTLRNNIKHQGVMPNITQSKTLITPIQNFFEKSCNRFLGIDWLAVSMADLIQSDEIRNMIKETEKLISQNKFKEALNQLAIVKFEVFDKQSLKYEVDPIWPRDEEEREKRKAKYANRKNIFLVDIKNEQAKESAFGNFFSDTYEKFRFIEKGISKDLLERFKDLTAEVGINNTQEWDLILRHSTHYWGKANWTRENALYCYNFLIDAIVKDQRNIYSDQPIKMIHDKFKVRINKEEIIIKINNSEDVFKMEKDKEYLISFLSGYAGGKWENYNREDIFIIVHTQYEDKNILPGYLQDKDKDKLEIIDVIEQSS